MTPGGETENLRGLTYKQQWRLLAVVSDFRNPLRHDVVERRRTNNAVADEEDVRLVERRGTRITHRIQNNIKGGNLSAKGNIK